MANSTAVDWTVDKLLSSAAILNARAESTRATLAANRSRYMETLRSMAQVSNADTKAMLRAKLTDWIHRQVELENRYQAFARQWAAAKAVVKNFLASVHITPPGYLSALVLAPVAVWSLVAAGIVTVGALSLWAANHGKNLDGLSAIVTLAVRDHWSPAAVTTALREFKDAAAGPGPLGLDQTLKDALPLVLLVGGLMIFGPLMKRRFA